MLFKTLEHIPIKDILNVFNLSFSDYVIPFHITKKQFEDKILSDNIKLNLSAGVFENNQLIGILLHGVNSIGNLKIAYNAGTGVIPTKRGNKLATRLYDYILPILKKEKIDKVILEVIQTNNIALNIYKHIGFEVVRNLDCFSGTIEPGNQDTEFKILEVQQNNWRKFQSFWSNTPSWQNNICAIENLRHSNSTIGIYHQKKIFGYVVFNPEAKRIQQLAIQDSYRQKGAGLQLVHYIADRYGKEISIINIDSTAVATINFIKKIGLKKSVSQYEMELKLH